MPLLHHLAQGRLRLPSLPVSRAAETRPLSPPRPAPPPQPRNLVERQKRSVALVLHKWIKEHRFLKAVPVEQGESSVALLFLWEVDHGKPYPSRAVDLIGRLSSFTKALKDAVTVDRAVCVADL